MSATLRSSSIGERPDSPHGVQFYETDTFLVDVVACFVGAGLGAGDAAVVIATPEHRVEIEARLTRRGLDVARAVARGDYVALDARETVGRLMVAGLPDPRRFSAEVGEVLRRAAGAQRRPVHAFGEMVALLWADGWRAAALRLEALWNELGAELSFSLLCAYPVGAFARDADAAPFLEVCGAHSQVIPAESYTTLSASEQQLRAVAGLQQRARALQTEVSDHRFTEDALRESTQTLRALVDSSPLAIVVVDPDTTVGLWNPAAERLFGWTEDEVLDRPMPVVPSDERDEAAALRAVVARGEVVVGLAMRRVRRDGAVVEVLVSAVPLRGRGGALERVVLTFEDVTERNRLVGRRQNAMDEHHAKAELLAMLGHELQNPVATVRNAVATATLDPTRCEPALAVARSGADRLQRLVDDLLDVARITQGRIALRREWTSLAGVVERGVEAVRSLVDERGHALTVVVPAPRVQVDGDATRLEQVVANLVGNAAAYTDAGGRITVSADYADGTAVVRVRDDGIGIAPAMLPRVFDLFAQADRARGGLGIGLTVVKQLVELHGGRVEAHSAGLGQGAELVVRLPAMLAAGTVESPAASSHRR